VGPESETINGISLIRGEKEIQKKEVAAGGGILGRGKLSQAFGDASSSTFGQKGGGNCPKERAEYHQKTRLFARKEGRNA